MFSSMEEGSKHHRTCLQEMTALMHRGPGAKPDENIPLSDFAYAPKGEVKDKRLEDELYPGCEHCHHLGCWHSFGSTSKADGKHYEKLHVMHPGQRTQRLQDSQADVAFVRVCTRARERGEREGRERKRNCCT